MKIKDILNTTHHRPWNMPDGAWRYYQEWNNAIFLHWQVELSELDKFIPKELEIDLFEGKPWVSVVAFTMEKIRPRNLPSFPPISDFDEINIRTYVKFNNKRGVYFLSIEGGTLLSCKIAKKVSGLPYRFSRIERTKNQYESFNIEYDDELIIKFKIEQKLQRKTKLDIWLTERYALFQDTSTSINAFEIHHLEWPIYEIDLKELDFKYSRFSKLIRNEPKKAHYSFGVKVVAWEKDKKKRTSYSTT